jgi:Bacterial archaeo-eukaryotic release factor family 10
VISEAIASLHSPAGTLVSAYVNRRPSATRAELVDMLKPLREVDRDRSAEKAVRADTERLVGLAPRIETEDARAAAVFMSGADGIFEYLPLDCPVEPVASVGPRPYLRPLRSRPRPMRTGVIVAETARARVFERDDAGMSELGDELVADVGKDNFAGFAGYEEHRIRARAEAVAAKMWREAGRRLLEAHRAQPFDLIVVGGHEESLESVAGQLHPYLRSLPQGRVIVDPHTLSISELGGLVADQVAAVRRGRIERLLADFLGEVGRDGQAVAGVAPVLAACNAHAVARLLVAGPFSKPGVVCDACRWLARTGSNCDICGGALYAVHDVVAEAMEVTLEAGGEVEVVDIASPLDADGVGAMLRFALPRP